MPRSSSDEVELARAVVRAAGLDAQPPAAPRPDLWTLVDHRRGRTSGRVAPRRRGRRIVGIAAAAAAVALVVLVPVGPPTAAATPPLLDFSLVEPDELVETSGAPARDVLLELAAAADRRQAVPADAVQATEWESWYSVVEGGSEDRVSYLVPTVSRTWLAADGSLAVAESRGAPLDHDGRSRPDDPAAGAALSPETVDLFQAGSVDPDLPAELLRHGEDPDRLRTALEVAGPCEVASELAEAECAMFLLRTVTGLYERYVVPPELDAALWRMLAREESLITLGTTVDRRGRAGVAVALRAPELPVMVVLVISPETGALLAHEDVLVVDQPDSDIVAPVVAGFSTYLGGTWQPAGAGPEIAPDMVCRPYPGVVACHLP